MNILLAVSVVTQRSHSFKQIKGQIAPQTANQRQRHSASRGGSNGPEEEDLFDERGKSAQHFIASFESELAGIRREAEQAAEIEIRKLRELIEGKAEENQQTGRDALTLSSYSFDDRQRDETEMFDHEVQPGLPDAEVLGRAMSTEEKKTEPFGQPNNKTRVSVREKEESPLNNDQMNLQSESNQKVKQKRLADLGQKSMLPPPIEEKPGSAWFYLRSDLGRALCLFVATTLLAIMTQRLQQQAVAVF